MAEGHNVFSVLRFKAFQHARSDHTVPMEVRFDTNAKVIGVHFRSTHVDLMRMSRHGLVWRIHEVKTVAITESIVVDAARAWVVQHGVTHAMLFMGGDFTVDLHESLKSDPVPSKVLNNPESVIPRADQSRIYMVHQVGHQFLVFSHSRDTLNQGMKLISNMGLELAGVQSSIYTLAKQYILPANKDTRTVLVNGAGFVVVDQDTSARVTELAQRVVDTETRIDEYLTARLAEIRDIPTVFQIHDGDEKIRKLQTDRNLNTKGNREWVVSCMGGKGYYHITPDYQPALKPLPKSLLPFVVFAWVILFYLVGSAVMDVALNLMKTQERKSLATEIERLIETRDDIGNSNSQMQTRLGQSQLLGGWLRGSVNYQELLTILLSSTPNEIVIRSVSITENRQQHGTYTFVASIVATENQVAVTEYFTLLRERFAETGWILTETEPSGSQIKIVAAKAKAK